MYLLQGDIEYFDTYRYQLDDIVKSKPMDPVFEMYEVFQTRTRERLTYALSQLENEPDFSIDETYQFDRSEEPWAQSSAELDEIWRKRVKNDFLTLRLTEKPDPEIRKTLKRRYERLHRRVEQFNANDVYQTFINAFTLNLEPHTSYMSPSTSENFDISMRLSLEGIGAVLRSEDEYTVVQKTVIGGPAQLSGQLHAGDRIVGWGINPEGGVEAWLVTNYPYDDLAFTHE